MKKLIKLIFSIILFFFGLLLFYSAFFGFLYGGIDGPKTGGNDFVYRNDEPVVYWVMIFLHLFIALLFWRISFHFFKDLKAVRRSP